MTTNGTSPKAVRAGMITELKDMIRSSQGMVFMDYRGLDSEGMYDLRKTLRLPGVRLKVVKNTLMSIACSEEKVAGVDSWLVFNTAVAFVGDDPVAVVKALSEFSKSHEQVKLKGGVLDGAAVDLPGLKALAALPGKRDMLAKTAGVMKGVLARGARDFSWLIARLAMDMRAHVKAKGGM